MSRFVLLSTVLLVVVLGAPAVAAWVGGGGVPQWLDLGSWSLEAVGLIVVYLVFKGRMGAAWLDGLLAGWTAWIFRGPATLMALAASGSVPSDPRRLATVWLIQYTVSGLVLAWVASRHGVAGR